MRARVPCVSDVYEANPCSAETQRCDFCGRRVSRVRRVALDGVYDRLRVSHRELYACPTCSEAKEQARSAGTPGNRSAR